MTNSAAYLVETLLTLLAVLALVVLVLGVSRKLGVGAPEGPIELVGRLPLDARRVVYLVRVGPQVLVLGASEAGLTKLAEVPGDSLGPLSKPPSKSFAEVLSSLTRKGGEGSS